SVCPNLCAGPPRVRENGGSTEWCIGPRRRNGTSGIALFRELAADVWPTPENRHTLHSHLATKGHTLPDGWVTTLAGLVGRLAFQVDGKTVAALQVEDES